MDKYDGITKVEVNLDSAQAPQTVKKKKKRFRFLNGFVVRLICAGLIIGALFGLRAIGADFSNRAVETVSNAVQTDFLGGNDNQIFLLDRVIEFIGSRRGQ